MDESTPILPIRAEGVTKKFGLLRAVDGVTLELGEGERLGLFGRNGAGKTTFLRLLAGLARPNAGHITFGQYVVPGDLETIHGKVGFLSHHSLLYPDLSVWENLIFASRLFGVEGMESRIEECLSRVGMLDRRRERVRNLSSGMERRVAVARALLHRPTVLFLDEPFAGLDAASIRFLQEILSQHRAEGGSIILTTHRLEAGIEDATRAVIFDRGKIVYEGVRQNGEFRGLTTAYDLYVEGKR
jgi:heme exporter protein A